MEPSDDSTEYQTVNRYCRACRVQAKVRLRIQPYVIDIECSACGANYTVQRYGL